MKALWRSDWLPGLLLGALFFAAAPSDLLQGLERKAYDLGVRYTERTPNAAIAIIGIDDASIANLGRWPWSRDRHRQLIDFLSQAGARVIAYTVFFVEPQTHRGGDQLERIGAFFEGSALGALAVAEPVPDAGALADPQAALQADARALGEMLRDARSQLNGDDALARSIAAAGNVILGAVFELGEPATPGTVPSYMLKQRLGGAAPDTRPYSASKALIPIPALGTAAARIGHLNANLDADGGLRAEPLTLRFGEALYPALSLQVAAGYRGIAVRDLVLEPGHRLRFGNTRIQTDPVTQMRTHFYGKNADGKPAFVTDSFFDVLSGKIRPEKYRDRIVLVGATATGIATPRVTPISPAMAPVEVLAHTVSSILNEDYFVAPAWAPQVSLGALALIALYLALALPRLRAAWALWVTLFLALGLMAGQLALMAQRALWVPLMIPVALLLSGHLLLVSRRFLITERGKTLADASSATSNRMLGTAFQDQGQLDMAFEKLRQVPLENSLMDVLYNLALDFERRRQFGKAGAVFAYMAGHDRSFRDITQRIERNRKLENTVLLGGSATDVGTLALESGGVEKPMLGRYEIDKEIGKGAMGVVYQGRDPRINRVVAIKTVALSQEFEADEMDEVRARFFREAETAGRLSHPNIVTIYDVGEEQDLAYIAMELLTGTELSKFTAKQTLLPLPRVLHIVVQVADALAYAHANKVVHRDIKPANIMVRPEGEVKVTDFGIARITDASRTKTGTVLGTPSYMSPEQLMGRKIDGRSDLFSLGAMFYQLVIGRLPFTGDSLATLTYRIANEAHTDVLRLRPELPACVSAIINRALEKPAEKRYQSAGEMLRYLHSCEQSTGKES